MQRRCEDLPCIEKGNKRETTKRSSLQQQCQVVLGPLGDLQVQDAQIPKNFNANASKASKAAVVLKASLQPPTAQPAST